MSDTTRTVIALGCSTDRDYNFLLPLTALLWREHIGHHPLALLVGDEFEWFSNPRTRVALDALDRFQISRKWLGHLPGYPDHTLAQNCRQHAAAVETIFPSSWVMPADADLWPLRKEFYQAHVNAAPDTKAVIYYSNGDHFQGKKITLERAAKGLPCQTIPTCHVAMRAETWRQVYGISATTPHYQVIPNGDVTAAVKHTLDTWFAKRQTSETHDANMVRWMSDQQIMTEKLCEQEWFPEGVPPDDRFANSAVYGKNGVYFVPRRGHPPVDRLDRSHPQAWRAPFNPNQWTDAHVHKAPDSPEHWETLLPIVGALLPKHAAWAKEYHRRYVEASK